MEAGSRGPGLAEMRALKGNFSPTLGRECTGAISLITLLQSQRVRR